MTESTKNSTPNTVLVCGDLIIDNHIYKGRRSQYALEDADGTEIIRTLGGAHLTYSLIKIPNNSEDVNFLYNPTLAFDTIEKHPENHAYAEWEIIDEKTCNFKQALGYGILKNRTKRLDYNALSNIPNVNPDIIVVDDGGLGFRQNKVVSKLQASKCTILKTNKPLARGLLWNTLSSRDRSNKLITLLSINELRKHDIKVSSGISWEQTCLDLCYELVHHHVLQRLLISKFIVISIGAVGAIVVKNGNDPERAEFALAFDPGFMEGEWETEAQASGIGQMCAFTAGFTYDLMQQSFSDLENINIKDIINNAKTGTYFLRKLLKNKAKWPALSNKVDITTAPFVALNKENHLINLLPLDEEEPKANFTLSDAFIPSPYWYEQPLHYLKDNLWSIFLNNYDHEKRSEEKKDIYTGEIVLRFAFSAAQKGIEKLKHAPYLQCNKLFTLDRNEIESLRNTRKLITQYINNKSSNPFNLAVFGPPGAGKSFAVKQIAYSIYGDDDFRKKAELLTFNLSQFRDESELAGAFHKIRDVVLLGKIPFVFWDEFDSEQLKWLQYFLAPMQDGEFQEGKDIHPIGKCVFIFAGGTIYEMQAFEPVNPEKCAAFKAKKGTDFQSRLHAYINVLGPNRKLKYERENDAWGEEDPADMLHPVRRALFLRAGLGIAKKDDLKMDPGLIMAFLKISKYNNGSRSLSRILDHLKSRVPGEIMRSDLPSAETLSLNIDFDEFLSIANESRSEFPLEELAQGIHLGWLGIVDKIDQANIYRKEYQMLPEDIKFDNILAAKRMLDMLRENDFNVVRIEDPRPSTMLEFIKNYIEDKEKLELLAEKEHQGWMKARDIAGWSGGPIRNDYLKIHPSFMAYPDLDESEKDKDRKTVRKIPDFFANIDFKIVKTK